jgi:hypothetical protein
MADAENPLAVELASRAVGVRIEQQIPVVVVDGVSSHWFGQGLAKLHFARFDPHPDGTGAQTKVPVIQLVMSAEQFAGMVAFLDKRLNTMIEVGAVSAETVSRAKEYLAQNPAAENEPR